MSVRRLAPPELAAEEFRLHGEERNRLAKEQVDEISGRPPGTRR